MHTAPFRLPDDKHQVLARARKYEWLTAWYMVSVAIVVYLTMGSSQAMKTMWVEDMLGIIPPALFVIVHRVRHWRPNEEFPYGYFRAVTIGFLCAAVTLLAMGTYLLVESLMVLVTAEHPDVGATVIFGHVVWSGWIMIPAILYSGVPTIFLGIKKRELARQLYDKILFTDAEMNKASWLSGGAALIGIFGIGIGWWWADAVAAIIISLDIVHDGLSSVKEVVKDLMDSAPTTVDHKAHDPLPLRVQESLAQLPWVREVKVRMREYGNIIFGEAFVVATTTDDLPEKLESARRRAMGLDWRLHDFVVTAVTDMARVESPPMDKR